MTQRVDNTKSMARFGRVISSLIVVAVWMILQTASAACICQTWGLLIETKGGPPAIVAFLFGYIGTMVVSACAYGALVDIWKGSPRITKP